MTIDPHDYDYIETLNKLDPETRKQLLEGKFDGSVIISNEPKDMAFTQFEIAKLEAQRIKNYNDAFSNYAKHHMQEPNRKHRRMMDADIKRKIKKASK